MKEEIIKEVIEMVVGPVQVSSQEEGSIFRINIQSPSAHVLIGDKGRTMKEIQPLLRLIIRKKTDQDFIIDLDINNYKKNKADQLMKVAQEIADRVVLINEQKVLPPMSSYERRIIHLSLQDRDDVATESIGEGMDRRVVVKPNQQQ